jgi:hypothetical protein
VTIVFTKGKHPFIHKFGYHTSGYIMGYMSFVQVVKMGPTYQKQNGHENLVLMPRVISKVTSYLLASLTQSTQNFVSLHPIVTKPSPHRCPTWHQSPRGRQVSYPNSRKQNRSLHTCAQNIQITCTANNTVNRYNISLN